MTTTDDTAVLIAGGGIGGFALSIALAGYGISSRVLERNAVFTEAGAGIQIGPNGMHILERLGVASFLEARAGSPIAIRVREGATATHLADLPLGDWIAGRHGAPYRVAHRADLQEALLAQARRLPAIEIVGGFEVAEVRPDAEASGGGGVTVTARDGRRARGRILVGADGIWSRVRAHVAGDVALPFSRKTATRTVLTRRVAPIDADVTGVWLSPDAHVVHYPVRGGAETAVVVIADDDWREPGWAAPVERVDVMARLARFHPSLRAALEAAPEWRRWALFDPAPLAGWTRGPVALLGDAAHPVLPFLAQGGVLALEDAVVLADALAARADDPRSALAAYERARRPRAAAVQAASRRNGRIYHMTGLAAVARNAVLRTVPGARLMASYDWLYGWRAEPPARGGGTGAEK